MADYHKIGTNKKAKFEEDFNLINFLYGHLKEMLAVTTYLLCFSRIGNSEFMAAPFILYFVLIAYAFPYLNPALFWSLRLGPYFNYIKQNDRCTQEHSAQLQHVSQCLPFSWQGVALQQHPVIHLSVIMEQRSALQFSICTEQNTTMDQPQEYSLCF